MLLQVEETEKGLAVILPNEVANNAQLVAGSSVDLTISGDKIQIAPVRRSKYRIEDLMAGVTDENLPEKIDFGPPVGKELFVTLMAYAPKRGDVVNIDLSPQVGHEQAGYRPALVMSSDDYNRRVGLAVVCPISNQSKGYTFRSTNSGRDWCDGVVMADQAKSVDWQGRGAVFRCEMPAFVVSEVLERIISLIE